MSWFHQTLNSVKKFNPFAKREDRVKKYEASIRTYKPTKPVAKEDKQMAWFRFLARLQNDYDKVQEKYALIRRAWSKRPRVVVEDIVRLCPGGRHAWVMSNVGLIRKPYSA